MIVLFTDYGIESPYVGQIKAILHQRLKRPVIIDLCHNAPSHNPMASAYLLASWINDFAENTLFVCIVDPMVGNAQQQVALVEADGRWFLGPDNGLFNKVAQQANTVRWWDVNWRPEKMSSTFHGRDLYIPIACKLVARETIPNTSQCDVTSKLKPFWGSQLSQITYIDSFGNAMTGLYANAADGNKALVLEQNGQRLPFARTYSDVSEGRAFWYANAYNMIEIAVNQGRAADTLNIHIGDGISLQKL